MVCDLTPRQQQILRMIAEEETTIGISQALHLSPKTVEYHRMELMKLTRIWNPIGLTKLAIRLSLVPNPCGVDWTQKPLCPKNTKAKSDSSGK